MGKKVWQGLLFFLIFSQMVFSGCSLDKKGAEEVVKINDISVSAGEFMLYLYEAQTNFENLGGSDIWEMDFDGQAAEEVAKDNALNTLKLIKITCQKANDRNITLNEEEKEKAVKDGQELLNSLTEEERDFYSFTTEELEKVMTEKALYNKMYDEVTKDYVISEADFEVYFEQNKDALKDAYTVYSLKTILMADEKTAKEALERAKAGEDFNALFLEYEIDETQKEKGGMIEAYRGQLENLFNITFDLKPGEISEVLPAAEGYYIVKAESVKEPDEEEELKPLMRKEYESMRKQQLFNQEYAKWQESAVAEKNEAVWNEIHVYKKAENQA